MKRSQFLGAAIFSGLLLAVPPAICAAPITVDGSDADWTIVNPPQVNMGLVQREADGDGWYVWNDAAGDERTDFESPDPRVDLRRFVVTGDSTYLYILAKFTNIPDGTGTGTFAPQLQVCIDTDHIDGSGLADFSGLAETQVNAVAEWEYQFRTMLGGATPTQVGLYRNASFSDFSLQGNVAVSTANDLIELRIPWTAFDLTGPPTTFFRMTVGIFRANSDDNSFDPGGPLQNAPPDLLDCITTYFDPGTSPNTFSEISSDTSVDYSFDVHFDATGNVKPSLLVSEIFYDTNGSDTVREWIEIYNNTNAPIRLENLKVGDEETADGTGEGMARFPSGADTIAAGEWKVVALNATATNAFFSLYGYLPDYEVTDSTPTVPNMRTYPVWCTGAAFALANGGDQVLVLDRSDTIQDIVVYEVSTFTGVNPGTGVTTGLSYERTVSNVDTNDVVADFSGRTDPQPGTNDAPTLDPIGTQNMNEDGVLSFTTAGANPVYPEDIDATTRNIVVTMAATNGVLTIGDTTSLAVTGNGTGSVSATGSQALLQTRLETLTYTPTPNFGGSATMTVVVNDQGNWGNGGAKFTTETLSILITPIADPPTLVVSPPSPGTEDTTASLTLTGSPGDGDGSETLSYEVSGVPAGASFTVAGVELSPGVFEFTAAQASGLGFVPPANYPLDPAAPITLSIRAKGTETLNADVEYSAPQDAVFTFAAVADAPNLSLSDAAGLMNTPIALTVSASLVDTDGSESLSIQVSDVPAGATLSAGTVLSPGVWGLTPGQLAGLTVTPPANSAADFTLQVSAIATESSNANQAATTLPLNVVVDPPASVKEWEAME